MKVLVVGSGGREHALIWKLSQSPLVEKIYCAPGNGGTVAIAKNLNISVDKIKILADFAEGEGIELTVVGPEAPLVAGIVDLFEKRGLKIFGPRKEAAQMEGSKSFAKNIMQKYDIPTGFAKIFTDHKKAVNYIENHEVPLVIKADGLAAGKGVFISESKEEAKKALDYCFVNKRFGSAGDKVIIEEYLEGEEVSLLVFTDGETVLPMVPAQDYKRIYDGDLGPNTGGMGSYSPVPTVTEEIYNEIVEKALKSTIEGLKNEGIEYRGVLYGGIILTKDGPKVLEFNCRFGDPETQAILPRLESDLAEIMLAVAERRLANYGELKWSPKNCVTVVLASSGYPGKYEEGFEIKGIEGANLKNGVVVFQAGTVREGEGVVTAGGRVLNVSALGNDFKEARERVYEAIKEIDFNGMYYRKDIALRAVKSQSGVGSRK
ncbi:MAG TPA: phosphoribosylamine--glycine ligase [Actinobacteria bacterium]|nr:phosphoribosylamine--glycine ligase [Actinomycetota bacterium]